MIPKKDEGERRGGEGEGEGVEKEEKDVKEDGLKLRKERVMLTQASGREARRREEAEQAGGLAQGGGHAEMGLLVFFF